MPLDDLWRLHEQINVILSARIIAEKRQLEKRLVLLNGGKHAQAPRVELKSGKADSSAASISEGSSQVSKSRRPVRDLVRTGQATTMTGFCLEGRSHDRGFSKFRILAKPRLAARGANRSMGFHTSKHGDPILIQTEIKLSQPQSIPPPLRADGCIWRA
jgi:hypothetical protein